MEIFGIMVFDSTHAAIKAEDTIQEEGISARLIGTPESVVAGCGLSLKFELDDTRLIKDTIEAKNIEYKGFYRGKREGFKSHYSDLNLEEYL